MVSESGWWRGRGGEAKRGGVRRSTKRMKCFIELPLCASCPRPPFPALMTSTTTRLPARASCLCPLASALTSFSPSPPFHTHSHSSVHTRRWACIAALPCLCSPSFHRAALPLMPLHPCPKHLPSSSLPSLLPLHPKTTAPAPASLPSSHNSPSPSPSLHYPHRLATQCTPRRTTNAGAGHGPNKAAAAETTTPTSSTSSSPPASAT